MIIGLDFDGPIANDPELKQLILKQRFNIELPIADCRKSVLVPSYISLEQFSDFQNMVFADIELVGRLPVTRDAANAITLLRHDHEVRIITSRSEETGSLQVAHEWLKRNHIEVDDLIGCGEGVSKADKAKGCDIFVDDDLRKLEQLVGIVPHLFLFSTEQNEDVTLVEGVRRVRDWGDLFLQISRIIKEQ